MTILHITPHLGGGVGAVICAWLKNDSSSNKHFVVSLDNNINKDNYDTLNNLYNCTIFEGIWNKKNQKISESDVVILHWWNHPLTFDFIYNVKLLPCRLIVWCHTACTCPPNVLTEDVVNYADKVVFTSPVSYSSRDVKKLVKKHREKFELIWSTSGVEKFLSKNKTEHNGFVVGYIGTADFSKLYNNFIKLCSKITDENVRFEVYTIDSQEELKKQSYDMGIVNRFFFGGKVPHDKMPEILARFDVLGYPLQKGHYGTCEQALGEAMAAGIVPVCMNNPCEKNIVENGVNGFLCKSEKEYVKTIESLISGAKDLKALSDSSRVRAKQVYSIEKMIEKWDALIESAVERGKHCHFCGLNQNSLKLPLLPHELYIRSLGRYGKPFGKYVFAKRKMQKKIACKKITKLFRKNHSFLSNSKGSPIQYLKYFKDSEILLFWSNLARQFR